MQPPGRKVYQRGGYSIWEIDGAQASVRLPWAQKMNSDILLYGEALLPKSELIWQTVYRSQGMIPRRDINRLCSFLIICFGSQCSFTYVRIAFSKVNLIPYQVDNFLFYVLCDAATSRHDQVMAFFSKVHNLK